MFPLCPICLKPELPSGLMVVYSHIEASTLFCSGEGECAKVICSYCGCVVHPQYHSWQSCNQMQRRRKLSLCEDEVLCEAEAILRDARTDGKWDGADG